MSHTTQFSDVNKVAALGPARQFEGIPLRQLEDLHHYYILMVGRSNRFKSSAGSRRFAANQSRCFDHFNEVQRELRIRYETAREERLSAANNRAAQAGHQLLLPGPACDTRRSARGR